MNGIWSAFFLGTFLVVLFVWFGWLAGRFPSLPPVQAVQWWVRRVVLPILRSQSWLGRAAIIFANNITILTTLVLLGPWPGASLLGVTFVGLSLGIAFRIIVSLPDQTLSPCLMLLPHDERRVRLGLALNMFEPPAILYAITLSIARWMVPMPAESVWKSYLIWVVPAMLIAAAGEALWLGAGRNRANANENFEAVKSDAGRVEQDSPPSN